MRNKLMVGKTPPMHSSAPKYEMGDIRRIPKKPPGNVTGSKYNEGSDTDFRGKGTWKK